MIGYLTIRPLIWTLIFIGFSFQHTHSELERLNNKPNHALWERILQSYVDEAGQVDYATLKKQPGALLGYLDHLSDFPPQADWSRADSLAYYINLYNAATVKLILEHYPVASIRDIPSPWSSKVVRIGKGYISLGHIEHRILRKMDETRIHFAINCASLSCPRLWNHAFTAEAMENQLKQVTSEFINDPTLNQLGDSSWELSQIFNWYKGDFKSEGGVRNYIARYANITSADGLKVGYKKYDWSLNDVGE